MTDNLRPRFGEVPKANPYHRSFCGPAAIAVLTGENVERVEQNIDSLRKASSSRTPRKSRRALVVGMWPAEVLRYLESRGLLAIEVDARKEVEAFSGSKKMKMRQTVNQWLKATAKERGNDVYLICTTSHFLIICGAYMVDNQERGKVRFQSDMKYKRAKIDECYCILRNV